MLTWHASSFADDMGVHKYTENIAREFILVFQLLFEFQLNFRICLSKNLETSYKPY